MFGRKGERDGMKEMKVENMDYSGHDRDKGRKDAGGKGEVGRQEGKGAEGGWRL